MAIRRPDHYEHTNSDLHIVNSEEVKGGLKVISTFNNTQLAALKVDKVKEGTLIYAEDTNTLYKLDDIANYDNTSGYNTIGGGSGDVVDDTSPQLGGDLDLNSNDITGTGDINITGSISLTGTVDGRDIATDGTKLDGVEAGADVTDETNVISALDGATILSATVDAADLVLFQDADDTNNLKAQTAQNIANLKVTELSEDTSPQLGGDLDLNGNNIDFPTTANISDCLDEDNMSSDSATALATQQSIKAYVDRLNQVFSTVSDANTTIDFNSLNLTINKHYTSLTANRTVTVSNEVSGSQFVIDVDVASGEEDHQIIFSGPSSPNISSDWINGTSNGVTLDGSASEATTYTIFGWYNGTDWRINVTQF